VPDERERGKRPHSEDPRVPADAPHEEGEQSEYKQNQPKWSFHFVPPVLLFGFPAMLMAGLRKTYSILVERESFVKGVFKITL
jgi:hypothetical protein